MIDMSTSLDRRGAGAGWFASGTRGDEETGLDVAVEACDEAGRAAYRAFCREAVMSPSQHPVWVESWLDTHQADGLVVALARGGRPVMRMALEIVRRGPFTFCRYPGGSHANGNFPATLATGIAPVTRTEWSAMLNAIKTARPDIDLLALARHNPRHDGIANPLEPLSTGCSPNLSLAVDLSDGFEALLERMNGRRKRKKYRLQQRKFEEAGGHRLIQARTEADVDHLLSKFLELKAARFKQMGIHDVFAEPRVRAFFRALFAGSLKEAQPPFALDGVEVNGEIKAVNGLSFTRESVVCEFGAVSMDGKNTSPGFFLDYTNICQTAEDGRSKYDFSVGDEEYKRSWCEIETRQFDVTVPLRLRGRAVRAWQALRGRTVAMIKSNTALWARARKLRKRLAGSA